MSEHIGTKKTTACVQATPTYLKGLDAAIAETEENLRCLKEVRYTVATAIAGLQEAPVITTVGEEVPVIVRSVEAGEQVMLEDADLTVDESPAED